MPTFDTPEPISATIQGTTGRIRIDAGDRTDTVVDIRPSDESSEVDVQAATQTRVEYAKGKLLVKTPKIRTRSLFGRTGSIDLTVELPSGSRVDAEGAAEIRCEGRLGDSKLTTHSGDIWLDQAGKLRLRSADGDITVGRSLGHTDVTTANGEIRIGEIDGTGVAKTANGDITLGEVTGDVRLNTAYGDITIDRAMASVGAKTATGDVRVGQVVRGAVVVATDSGELEVGVREGTAAWLDVKSHYGNVRVALEPCDDPRQADQTVQVRARTGAGDIVIRRS